MARAGVVATLLPGAYYFAARDARRRRSSLFRRHRVPMAVATDCNPGTSPLTSLLLAMNMAATLFRLTVEECLVGVTRNAARALGLGQRSRHAGSRQARRSRDLGHRAPGRARLSARLQSAARPRLERPMNGHASRRRGLAGRLARHLARRRRRARSRARAGDRRQRGGGRAHSRARASRSMASTPASASWPACASPTRDLPRLQRNIVLSHAAGVGEPSPVGITRLMMALKLASLAQGASGVQPQTLALLEAMLARRRDAGRAVAGLGRRLGRSGAAGAHGRGDDRRGRSVFEGARMPAAAGAGARRASRPLELGAEGRARAAQRHAILDRPCAGRPVRDRTSSSGGAGDRRAVDRRRARLRHAVRPAHPCAAPPSRADRGRRRACAH